MVVVVVVRFSSHSVFLLLIRSDYCFELSRSAIHLLVLCLPRSSSSSSPSSRI